MPPAQFMTAEPVTNAALRATVELARRYANDPAVERHGYALWLPIWPVVDTPGPRRRSRTHIMTASSPAPQLQ